ncbi:MAG: DsrE family protein [Thermoplasmata archaeon]
MRIGILLLTGPYQYQGADSAYHFAKAAIARGHSVEIFLYTDGVNIANKAISAPGHRNLPQMFSELGSAAGVTACGTCARFRGVVKDVLPPNIVLGGLGTLVKLLEECDRFLVFGSG